jgi:hypothetical protein
LAQWTGRKEKKEGGRRMRRRGEGEKTPADFKEMGIGPVMLGALHKVIP